MSLVYPIVFILERVPKRRGHFAAQIMFASL